MTIETIETKPKRKRRAYDPVKEKMWDKNRNGRSVTRYARWNEAAKALGFDGYSSMMTAICKGGADVIRKENQNA